MAPVPGGRPWWFVVAFAVAAWALWGATRGPEAVPGFVGAATADEDLVAHLLVGLAFAAPLTLARPLPRLWSSVAWVVLVATAVLGLLIEVVQLGVAGRESTPVDALATAAGGLIAWPVAWLDAHRSARP